jgi:quercetin dioxygenase-like cupin family protein
MSESDRPSALAVQPGDGESFWQPVPANGYVEVHVSRHRNRTVSGFESGIQEVAPGGHVREHAHDPHEELILVIEGTGTAFIEGEPHPMRPGTTVYLAPGHAHRFVNDGEAPLRFFWVLMPGGLSDFFGAIGRTRQTGEAAPKPFPRPDDVARIEQETVFAALPDRD